MTMNGPVTMLNAFIAPPAAQAARLPDHCCVHGVSPLLRLLLDQAVDLPALYDVEGRDGKLMALLIAEIAAMPRLHRARCPKTRAWRAPACACSPRPRSARAWTRWRPTPA